jgi:hypothetical protein
VSVGTKIRERERGYIEANHGSAAIACGKHREEITARRGQKIA